MSSSFCLKLVMVHYNEPVMNLSEEHETDDWGTGHVTVHLQNLTCRLQLRVCFFCRETENHQRLTEQI